MRHKIRLILCDTISEENIQIYKLGNLWDTFS